MNKAQFQQQSPIAPQICYVLGTGHCGSTLLSMMLNMSEQIFACGEIQRMEWGRTGKGAAAEFWKDVFEQLNTPGIHAENARLFDPKELKRSADLDTWRRFNLDALQAILDASGAELVLDASKSPARLRALLEAQAGNIKVIHLVRDSRAVVHSFHRKFKTFSRGCRRGKARVEYLDAESQELSAIVPDQYWFLLRYEDLIDRPDFHINLLCEFLDVEFQPFMLWPDPSAYFGVGGNRMRSKPFRGFHKDQSWRADRGLLWRLLTTIAVRRINSRYGYY